MGDKPLCLLALDGGGIRGLSELVVLQEIMDRIKFDLDVDGDLLPADFFDLIGGTSTGGLVALLLGRLRLSVPQARREYVRIAEEVFSLKQYHKKNSFDGRKLEDAVKRLLGNDRSEEKMLQKDGSCKVFVSAVPQQDVKARAGPQLFRTYRVRENATFNCTIWEACRATSAAPSYFEPIRIGEDGEQETFVDGGLGYNNPVELVLEEAGRIFPGRKVACVVSIGTGVAKAIDFPDSPKTSPVKLIKALKAMATESDTTAEKMHARFRNATDTYFRFSVDRGLQGIGLEEWKELSNVRTFTTEYLNLQIISEQVNKVVRAVLASKIVGQEGSSKLIQLPGTSSDETGVSQGPPQTLEWRSNEGSIPNFYYTIEQLASHIIASTSQRYFVVPFGKNKNFVGRESILPQLLRMIPPNEDKDDCQRTVIEGLGGIGKTQIAIEAAFRVRDQYPDCSIFWVPAIDATSFENAYREIGRVLKVRGVDEDKADVKALVKDALCDSAGSWLLIVDNADDLNLLFDDTSLADYLPFSTKGSILFTTRNHKIIGKLDVPQRNIIIVKEMNEAEGLELLKGRAKDYETADTDSSARLLEFLAYLPLAIRQASAYMVKNQISAKKYLELCQSSEESAIGLLSEEFTDRHRYQSSQNPVATTWLISFQEILDSKPLAAKYLKFMCFLAEKDIPQSLLPPAEEPGMVKAIGILKAYAFIIERKELDAYDIHRLVRLTMRNWLSREGELKACITDVIQQLANVFPSPEHENGGEWVRYLPHALKALELGRDSTNDAARLTLLWNAAESKFWLGNYKEAELLLRQTLALQIEGRGAKHPQTLVTQRILAATLCGLGNYKKAEPLLRQTLALQIEG